MSINATGSGPQAALDILRRPAASKDNVPAGQEKSAGNNFDSFKLSGSLQDLMEQTGASRITETVYTKKVYMSSQSAAKGINGKDGSSYEMYSNCACCYTYIERTLTIESDKIKGGVMTITGCAENSVFSMNMKGSTDGISFDGAGLTDDMRDKIREFMSQQAGMNAGEYEAGRERFNKCADYLADIFGEDMSAFMLDEKAYDSLFGKIGGEEETFLERSLKRLQDITDYMRRLSDYMDRIFKGLRGKDPSSGAVNAFGEAYFRLDIYSYSEISLMADKVLSSGEKGAVVPAEAGAFEGKSLKAEMYSYTSVSTTTERILTASGVLPVTPAETGSADTSGEASSESTAE